MESVSPGAYTVVGHTVVAVPSENAGPPRHSYSPTTHSHVSSARVVTRRRRFARPHPLREANKECTVNAVIHGVAARDIPPERVAPEKLDATIDLDACNSALGGRDNKSSDQENQSPNSNTRHRQHEAIQSKRRCSNIRAQR